MGTFVEGAVRAHCRSGPRFWIRRVRSAPLPLRIEFSCGDVYQLVNFTPRGWLYERRAQ